MQDQRPKVLVLDEDLMALELYSRELGSNYQVVTSQSIEDAHQHLKNNLFLALIIEPTINGDEGWTLLREIRASPNPPKVILCSVLDDRKVGLEQGADAFVVKPVLPTTLHRLIDQIISKKNLLTSPRNG
ncbi:MAG: response regulator [Anaerolineaceae bacterium]|nr:response regulator [Anaerolineaceae bacterium]